MDYKLPLISVVTVVYNGVNTLERTMQSVLGQTYSQIEYILIDGNSTDGTSDLINAYGERLDYWISEPDKGIYDAMNKGIEQCRGDFTLFLNSGDYLYSDGLFERLVSEHGAEFHTADILYGDAKIIRADGSLIDLEIEHSHDELWKGPCFRHGASLVRTSLLKEFKFELSDKLKIAADNDFFYKCYTGNYRFFRTKLIFIAYLEEGASDNRIRQILDYIYILKKHKDWNYRTQKYALKRYLRELPHHPVSGRFFHIYDKIFKDYLPNHLVNRIPFYCIRHWYYRTIVGLNLEKNASIHLRAIIKGTNISIGKNTVIDRSCFLDGRGRLDIGENSSISPDVQLITQDHEINSAAFSIRMHELVIGDYVWIGQRALISGNIHIGQGAVISAGSVVTEDVEAFTVVQGNPARKTEDRRKDLNYNPGRMDWLE